LIEKQFDIPFLANLSLREKQIQQNYRPIIGVHKWFARRPGTLFRGLLLAEFGSGNLQDLYYKSNSLAGITVADPFMGGGTPVLEANRLDCNVIGCDINPMAYWIVQRELATLDPQEYRLAANDLINELKLKIGAYYNTRCSICGSEGVPVKYFLWVKTWECRDCGQVFDLFPGYILATNQRHPHYVLICSKCGDLNEVDDYRNPGPCRYCHEQLNAYGPARGNRCTCPHCGEVNRYPQPNRGVPKHRMVALEYYCPYCKKEHKGRFYKKPDLDDLLLFRLVEEKWAQSYSEFVPKEEIPTGDETNRLHRWGYRRYHELFNPRQLMGLDLSCRIISSLPEGEIRAALATNLSDLLRYQNMLCRYDNSALKSLDIFSVHGFPVGLIQCESNLLGIVDESRGINVGSGGWTNIVDKYARAKEYCRHPFEIKHLNKSKIQVPIPGEWIGSDEANGSSQKGRTVHLYCGSSTDLKLPPDSLDAVFTDPPYFGNVQYAELMDFCYMWLRRLAGKVPGFQRASTRDRDELTGNTTMDRGLIHFLEGISRVFQNMALSLKPGAPLVFTYHHNDINAYIPLAVALLDAGLVCTASLPCPGEMGASIHINGTGSSIMDTVFVCRSTGRVPRRSIVSTPEEIAALVRLDLMKLEAGGVRYSQGDIRCITYGHLIRLAVWHLRKEWPKNEDADTRMAKIAKEIEKAGGWAGVKEHLLSSISTPEKQEWAALENSGEYGGEEYEITF